MTRGLNGIFVVALALVLCGSCRGEGLEKGNLAGLHLVSVTLNPNITLEDFASAFAREVLPVYEKNWPGLKGYVLKPFFSDAKNQLAIVWLFRTVADRNRYFDA